MQLPEEIKKYPFLMIIWEDIVSPPDNDWRNFEDSVDWADDQKTLVYQPGFQIESDENHIVLASSIFEDGTLMSGITKIPKGAIKKTITLIESTPQMLGTIIASKLGPA